MSRRPRAPLPLRVEAQQASARQPASQELDELRLPSRTREQSQTVELVQAPPPRLGGVRGGVRVEENRNSQPAPQQLSELELRPERFAAPAQNLSHRQQAALTRLLPRLPEAHRGECETFDGADTARRVFDDAGHEGLGHDFLNALEQRQHISSDRWFNAYARPYRDSGWAFYQSGASAIHQLVAPLRLPQEEVAYCIAELITGLTFESHRDQVFSHLRTLAGYDERTGEVVHPERMRELAETFRRVYGSYYGNRSLRQALDYEFQDDRRREAIQRMFRNAP